MAFVLNEIYSSEEIIDSISLDDNFLISHGGIIAKYDKDLNLIERINSPFADHLVFVNEKHFVIVRQGDVHCVRTKNSRYTILEKTKIYKVIKCEGLSDLKAICFTDIGITTIFFENGTLKELNIFDTSSCDIKDFIFVPSEKNIYISVSTLNGQEILCISPFSGKTIKIFTNTNLNFNSTNFFLSQGKGYWIKNGNIFSLDKLDNFIISTGKGFSVGFSIDVEDFTLLFAKETGKCFLIDDNFSLKHIFTFPYILLSGCSIRSRVLCYNKELSVLFDIKSHKVVIIKEIHYLKSIYNIIKEDNSRISITRSGMDSEHLDFVIKTDLRFILPENKNMKNQEITFVYKSASLLVVSYDKITLVNNYILDDQIKSVWEHNDKTIFCSLTTVYIYSDSKIKMYCYSGIININPAIGPILVKNNILYFINSEKSIAVFKKGVSEPVIFLGVSFVKSKNKKGVSSSSFLAHISFNGSLLGILINLTEDKIVVANDSYIIVAEEALISDIFNFYKEKEVTQNIFTAFASDFDLFSSIKCSCNHNCIVYKTTVYSLISNNKSQTSVDCLSTIINYYEIHNMVILNTIADSYIVNLSTLAIWKLDKHFKYHFFTDNRIFGCTHIIERIKLQNFRCNRNIDEPAKFVNTKNHSVVFKETRLLISNDKNILYYYYQIVDNIIIVLNAKPVKKFSGYIKQSLVLNAYSIVLLISIMESNESLLIFLDIYNNDIIETKRVVFPGICCYIAENKHYLAILNDNSVVVFNLTNLEMISKINLPSNIGAISIKFSGITSIIVECRKNTFIIIDDFTVICDIESSFRIAINYSHFTDVQFKKYSEYLSGEIQSTEIEFDSKISVKDIFGNENIDKINNRFTVEYSEFNRFYYKSMLIKFKGFKLQIQDLTIHLPVHIDRLICYNEILIIFGKNGGCYSIHSYALSQKICQKYEKALKAIKNWDQYAENMNNCCYNLINVNQSGQLKILLTETNYFFSYSEEHL